MAAVAELGTLDHTRRVLNMRSIVLITSFALLSLMLGCKPPTATPQSVQGRVLHYGIYTNQGEFVRVPSPNTPSGFGRELMESPVFLSETDKIPASLGVLFGFQFAVTGLPAEKIIFGRVVHHPPIQRPDGSVTTRSEFPSVAPTPTNGCLVGGFSFGFDYDYELVPGKWTLEIWHGSQKLTEKSFDVYKP